MTKFDCPNQIIKWTKFKIQFHKARKCNIKNRLVRVFFASNSHPNLHKMPWISDRLNSLSHCANPTPFVSLLTCPPRRPPGCSSDCASGTPGKWSFRWWPRWSRSGWRPPSGHSCPWPSAKRTERGWTPPWTWRSRGPPGAKDRAERDRINGKISAKFVCKKQGDPILPSSPRKVLILIKNYSFPIFDFQGQKLIRKIGSDLFLQPAWLQFCNTGTSLSLITLF